MRTPRRTSCRIVNSLNKYVSRFATSTFLRFGFLSEPFPSSARIASGLSSFSTSGELRLIFIISKSNVGEVRDEV